MPKIDISNEEYEFLKELRQELKTQDNRITANPIYGVMYKKRVWGMDADYCDGDNFAWIWDTEEYSTEEVLVILEEEYEYYGNKIVEWGERHCPEVVGPHEDENDKVLALITFLREGNSLIYTVEDFIEDIIGKFDITKAYYVEEVTPHTNSFSLFEKDAYDHLAMNKHNISGKAWTYAYSNFRTPRMEKLRKFLLDLNCFGVYAKDVHKYGVKK